MSNDDADQVPVALSFEPDLSTKQKKGAHKPIYAEVFTQKPVKARDNKHVHLLVNPFAGKRKGRKNWRARQNSTRRRWENGRHPFFRLQWPSKQNRSRDRCI